MFDLTLLDHLRLTFGDVIQRQKVHAQIASACAKRSRWLRAIEAVLMLGVTLTTLAAALGHGRGYAITSAVLATAALVALLVQLTSDLDGATRAHAASATRLWQIRERYQVLLSDLCDHVIDIEQARRQRDILMLELHGTYENAPPMDRKAYKAASTMAATAEQSIGEQELDVFLPKPLQKAARSTTA